MQTNFNVEELKEISNNLDFIIKELQKEKEKVDKKLTQKILLEKMKNV